MKPIPQEVPRQEVPRLEQRVAERTNSASEFTPRERWFVRGLIVLAAAIIAVGLWQTIGRDALLAVRSLPIFRRVTVRADIPSAIAATASRRDAPSVSSQPASSGLTGLPATSRSLEQRVGLNNATPHSVIGADLPGAVVANNAVVANPKPLTDEPLGPRDEASDRPAARDKQPTPDKPGATDPVSVDLLQTAAQLVSLGWQDYAYPAPWFASETSKPRMLYNGHRNSLLNAIAHPKPSALSLAQARKDYATAREQFRDDPRLDYAFGLMLWHHGERSEALEVFQTAARLEGTPFLPAALAVGWGRLLNGDERRGLDQLAHVAKLIGTRPDTTSNTPVSPTAAQREYAALCLGRAFGFLTGPGRNSELGEAVDLTARNVREHLSPEQLVEYEAGFDQVGQRQSDLLQLASLPQNAFVTEHRQQSDELQTRIDTLREEMKQTRDEIARDHISYLSTVTKYVTDALKARAESSKLQTTVKQLKDSILQLYQPQPHVVARSPSGALVPVNSNGASSSGSRTNRTTSRGSGSSSSRSSSRNGSTARGNSNFRPQIFLMPETTEERAARVAKLEKARTELKRIQTELTKVRERHQTLLDQRHAAEADQKTESKETQRTQADRRREQHALESKLKELHTALRQMQSLHNSLDTVAAYVPWQIPVEAEALRIALTKKPDPAANSLAK